MAAMIFIPIDMEEIMGRTSGRAALALSDEQRTKLLARDEMSPNIVGSAH
jgi:hypothetical protein